MNRKILSIVLPLVVVLLAAPLVGIASAGRGNNKLDFDLVFYGSYITPTSERTTGNEEHLVLPFITLPAFMVTPPYAGPPMTLKVGGDPVPPDRLSYSGNLFINLNVKNGAEVIKVEETITIKDGSGSVIGTLMIKAIGNVEQGKGVGAGNNFVGFGTGAFENVKIEGNTVGPTPVGTWNPTTTLTLPVLKVERVGTVMGWP